MEKHSVKVQVGSAAESPELAKAVAEKILADTPGADLILKVSDAFCWYLV